MIWRNYRLYILGALVFAVLICSTTAVAGVVEPQVQRMLAQSRSGEPLPIIVTLNDQVDLDAFAREAGPVSKMSKGERRNYRSRLLQKLRQKASASQGDLRSFLRGRGLDRVRDLWHVNSLAFTASPELIEQLAARPDVAAIVYDQPVSKPVVTPLADNNINSVEDNIDQVGAPQLWALGLTGSGTTVAIIDSGVFLDHQDLVGRWRGGSNSWFNAVAANCGDPQIDCVTACDTNTAKPCDYLDLSNIAHGTGVAGVAVGGDLSGNAIGVAPGAQWIAAKIFDNGDNSSVSIISQAFAWLIDPDGNPLTDDAPDVVNASWGFDPGQCVNLLQADVQALQAAGIAMAFSAGNDGPAAGTSVSPANYPDSFAVGSVWNSHLAQSTVISDFSGRGPSACGPELYPDVVAPGYVLTTDYLFGLPDQYVIVAGTSFASPHVTGAIALLYGDGGFPTVPLDVLYQALGESATDLGAAGPDDNYGHGLLNIPAAYNLLLPPNPVAVSPASGSTGLSGDVTLGWAQPDDHFGSVVTNQVLIDTDPLFSAPVVASRAAATETVGSVLFGMAGWVGLFLLPLGRKIRCWRRWLLLLMLLGVGWLGLMSCGGGGSAPPTAVVSGLAPGTTYFWKVTSQTDRGGPFGESAVFSFTTAL